MKIAMIDVGPAGVHVSFDRHGGCMLTSSSEPMVSIRENCDSAGDRPRCVTRSSQVHN